MGKFDGILMCTDLDGTLLRNDKSISKENLDAIEYFKAEGGYFTFVTGRMTNCVPDICETVHPNAPFGCINGGGLYDHRTQDYVWKYPCPAEALEMAADVEKHMPNIGIQPNTFEKVYFSHENSVMAAFRQITKVPNLVCALGDIELPLAKIVFGAGTEAEMQALIAFLHAHPKADTFDFIRSEESLYEILPKGSNKGAVIPKLTELLGTDMPMYSKMELGARRVRREQVPKLAELYKVDEKELMTLWLADAVYATLKEEDKALKLDAIDLAKEYFKNDGRL